MSDKKPWEEKFIQHPHLPERIVHADTGEVVARLEAIRYGPIFSAAPDMARALSALGGWGADEQWHLEGCSGTRSLAECNPDCMAARAALKKGGVL
jgi:hypothetical protein